MAKTPKVSAVEGQLPVLPLRDVVVYPHMVIPLFVGRARSISALDAAMEADKRILLVAQKSAEVDEPEPKDLYGVGTLSTILQLLKLPDGTVKVLVEGGQRAELTDLETEGEHFLGSFEVIAAHQGGADRELEVLMRSLLNVFDQYVKLNKKVPAEVVSSIAGIDDPERLTDVIAAHMALKLEEKQKLLEVREVRQRIEQLVALVEGEIDILQVEKRIRSRVKQQM